MNKKVSIFLVTLFIFSIFTATVVAAPLGRGRRFIDQNQDGICDNCQGQCQAQGQGQGQGQRQEGNAMNSASGRRLSYVDADGDGICDNRGTNKACPQKGEGRRNRNR